MERSTPTLVTLWLAGCVAPAALAAQEPAPLRTLALVDDLSGRPVAGATVVVEPGPFRGITDGQGHATFPLPGGSYTLSVTGLGYREMHLAVTVPPGPTAPLEVRMTPDPVQVEGLRVEGAAGRSDLEVEGRVLDASDRTPLAGATVSLPFGSRRQTVLADRGGTFRMRIALPAEAAPGAVWIQAVHLGYEGVAIPVDAAASGRINVDLLLRPDSVLLAGVGRVGARLRSDRNAMAGMSVRVVDRARIAERPWWRDTADMLRDSGVAFSPCADPFEPGPCVAARGGGGGDPMSVCIDGVPAVAGFEQLRTYHPREIHLVEVFGRGRLVHAYTVSYMEYAGRRAGREVRCPDPNVG